MQRTINGSNLALVGHPFAPIGMGEHVRCTFRALRAVGVRPGLVDVYGLNEPEPDASVELAPYLVPATRGINVFHINGDEVEQALATLAVRPGAAGAYNIVYPAWELARYPAEWARQLERFDEVWAPSRFIQEAVRSAVDRPVVHMPLACEVILSYFVGRRWFGIPEGAYAFLFFFDLRSYAARKNPQAVIEAFRCLLRESPFADCALVLKVNGAEAQPAELERLRSSLAELRERVVLIDRTLTDNEVKNLVRCCDAFVSLHRSEGFGRGLCEAMALGKPVIGTAYSGNMDFMSADTALLVDYRLVPVAPGQYPHWENQVWAEPDVHAAARLMARLLRDPAAGRRLGQRARIELMRHFSYRAAGVRYVERLGEIAVWRAAGGLAANYRLDAASPLRGGELAA
jgi:glycosyltransferase involved in cell wall biosynthesis